MVFFADDLERIFGPRAGAQPGEVIPEDPEELAEAVEAAAEAADSLETAEA